MRRRGCATWRSSASATLMASRPGCAFPQRRSASPWLTSCQRFRAANANCANSRPASPRRSRKRKPSWRRPTGNWPRRRASRRARPSARASCATCMTASAPISLGDPQLSRAAPMTSSCSIHCATRWTSSSCRSMRSTCRRRRHSASGRPALPAGTALRRVDVELQWAVDELAVAARLRRPCHAAPAVHAVRSAVERAAACAGRVLRIEAGASGNGADCGSSMTAAGSTSAGRCGAASRRCTSAPPPSARTVAAKPARPDRGGYHVERKSGSSEGLRRRRRGAG